MCRWGQPPAGERVGGCTVRVEGQPFENDRYVQVSYLVRPLVRRCVWWISHSTSIYGQTHGARRMSYRCGCMCSGHSGNTVAYSTGTGPVQRARARCALVRRCGDVRWAQNTRHKPVRQRCSTALLSSDK